MTSLRTVLRITLTSLVAVAVTGCWIGDTPAPELPTIDAGIGSGAGVGNDICDCPSGAPEGSDVTGLQGRVYRFTQMHIEEPYALAGLLNGMWSLDMAESKLNVLFSLDNVDASKTDYYPFRKANFRAASGWRTLNDDGSVDQYCMLPGTGEDMVLEPSKACAGRCEVQTVGSGKLNFHAGPKGQPMNCSPHLEDTPHSIPLSQVDASFVLSDDCSEFIVGRLSACLVREDADSICMCLRLPPNYDFGCTMNEPLVMDPMPEEPTSPEKVAYCKQCGEGNWTLLSAALSFMPGESPDFPPCDPPIGNAGYKVSGTFIASEVTDHFNPVESGDCTATEEGE